MKSVLEGAGLSTCIAYSASSLEFTDFGFTDRNPHCEIIHCGRRAPS